MENKKDSVILQGGATKADGRGIYYAAWLKEREEEMAADLRYRQSILGDESWE